VKDQLAIIRKCDQAIADAEARIAKADAEEERHKPARDAAVAAANDARTRAGHVRALASIGEGDEREAERLDAEATKAEARVAKIDSMMDGFAQVRAACETAIVQAREQRAQATREAVREKAEAFIREATPRSLRTADDQRIMGAYREVLASLGDPRELLHSAQEACIPAPVGEHVGPYGAWPQYIYKASLESMDPSARERALNVVMAELRRAGLEI